MELGIYRGTKTWFCIEEDKEIGNHDMFDFPFEGVQNKKTVVAPSSVSPPAFEPDFPELRTQINFYNVNRSLFVFYSRMTDGCVYENLEHLIIYNFVSQIWIIFKKQIG